jgi:hypothetical protein
MISKTLDMLEQCSAEESPRKCLAIVYGSLRSIYTLMRPADTGLGAIRRLSSMLAGVLTSYLILLHTSKLGEESSIEELLERFLEESKRLGEGLNDGDVVEVVRSLLGELGAGVPDPVPLPPEVVNAVIKDFEEYLSSLRQQYVWRRRARRPKNPVIELKRLLREIGRIDPILAREVHNAVLSRVRESESSS